MKPVGNRHRRIVNSQIVATRNQKEWVEQMLQEMEFHLPRMRRECSSQDFWKWLRGEAASATRNLSTREAQGQVHARIDEVIKRYVSPRPHADTRA